MVCPLGNADARAAPDQQYCESVKRKMQNRYRVYWCGETQAESFTVPENDLKIRSCTEAELRDSEMIPHYSTTRAEERREESGFPYPAEEDMTMSPAEEGSQPERSYDEMIGLAIFRLRKSDGSSGLLGRGGVGGIM